MEDFEKVKARLRIRQQELMERIAQISAEVRHQDIPLPSDFEDQATERENEEVIDALGSAARRELDQINRTLQHIDNGEYGDCRDCGRKISAARLEALPFASRCIGCAGRAEG